MLTRKRFKPPATRGEWLADLRALGKAIADFFGELDAPGALTINQTSELKSTGAITTSGSAGAGIGYTNGGAVTQATDKSTGVTLNAQSGEITMNNATLNGDTTVSFVLTNAAGIASKDLLILNHASGGTPGSYLLNGRCGAGSATIDVRNITTGNLSEAIVIRFAVIKGAIA